MTARDYFENVRDAVKEYNTAVIIRTYGRSHQAAFGRSSDISDPTAQRYAELAEADAVIEQCKPIIDEAEFVIEGLRVIMTSNAKIADVIQLRYLELMSSKEVAKHLQISRRHERRLHDIGLQLFDSMGRALLIEKGMEKISTCYVR